MPRKKNSLSERFKRGDDSVLNRNSSAERRLVEGVLLVKLGAYTAEFFSGKDLKIAPKFNLKATTGLPLSVGNTVTQAASGLVPSKGVGLDVGIEDIFAPVAAIKGGMRIYNMLNPAQSIGAVNPADPNSPMQAGLEISGEVDLDDFLIGVLTAGYLIEKANVDVGAIATGIGAGIADAVSDAKKLAQDAAT